MKTLKFISWKTSEAVLKTKNSGGTSYQEAEHWFIHQVEKYIFRGQEDSNWSIRPSIARYKPIGSHCIEFARKEMLNKFRIESSFKDIDVHTSILDWKKPDKDPSLDPEQFLLRWEMIAQHYGIPTRLVDWTDSFHVALFFAFGGWSSINIMPPQQPCIWCLNPDKLKKGGIDLRRKVAGELKAEYEDYLKYNDAVHIIEKEQNMNSRQRAQRGCFTYSTDYSTSLENYIDNNSTHFEKGTLIKIILKPNEQEEALRMLSDGLTTASHIRNDVEGVAKDAVNAFLRFKFKLNP